MGLGELCQQGRDRLRDEANALLDVARLEDLLTFVRTDDELVRDDVRGTSWHQLGRHLQREIRLPLANLGRNARCAGHHGKHVGR